MFLYILALIYVVLDHMFWTIRTLWFWIIHNLKEFLKSNMLQDHIWNAHCSRSMSVICSWNRMLYKYGPRGYSTWKFIKTINGPGPYGPNGPGPYDKSRPKSQKKSSVHLCKSALHCFLNRLINPNTNWNEVHIFEQRPQFQAMHNMYGRMEWLIRFCNFELQSVNIMLW